MSRVYDNWERLVRRVLRSDQRGHERAPSGIAGAVPDSLQRSTDINTILNAADEIQSENPNVARICKLKNVVHGFYFYQLVVSCNVCIT